MKNFNESIYIFDINNVNFFYIFLHIGIFLLKLFKKYYKIYILDNDKYMYIKYLDICCLKILYF